MRTRFRFAVVVVLTIAALGRGDAVAQLIGDAQLQRIGMYRYWSANLPIDSADSLEAAYLEDEALYVVTARGTFFAIEARTGLVRWADKVTEPAYRIYRPTHMRQADGAGPVIVTTTSETRVYDRFSGDLLQRFKLPFPPGGTTVGHDGLLFMGSLDGRFYSFQLDRRYAVEPIKRWTVSAAGSVTADPVLFDQDSLLFASEGGKVFACRGVNKGLLWSQSVGGSVLGNPVVDETGAYVATMDRALYKLNRTTGRIIWRRRMQEPLREGPVVISHTVYQFSPNDGLCAFDADTGADLWTRPEGHRVVSHTPNGDILATQDRRLLLVNNETGEVIHEIPATDVVATALNTRDDAVYALGSDGRVECARLNDVPYLRRQQIMAARARLNKPPVRQSAKAPVKRATKPTASRTDDPFRSRHDIKPK